VPSGAELVIMSGVLLSQSAKSVFNRRIKTNVLLTLLNIFLAFLSMWIVCGGWFYRESREWKHDVGVE
jgi:hypothetical protein